MNCPNCGASLGVDSVDVRACRFCGTAVDKPGPQRPGGIYIDENILKYIEDLRAASASTVDLTVLTEAAKAEAARAQRRYVIPSDVATAAREVLRVDDAVLRKALDETPVP